MLPLIKNNIDKVKSLCQAHNVDVFSLFGSATRKEFSASSDLDFLVRFSPNIPLLDYADNYFNLLEKLQQLFNRDIDLVSERSLKNPVLIDEIAKSKITIYES